VTGRPKPNFRLARPLFIREASASFGHTHQLSLQCASLGGEPTATGGDVKEGFGLCLGISWLSSALLFPSEGVEEDLLLCFWSIYIEQVLLGFLTHEGFPK
jgi:hypothetical protein